MSGASNKLGAAMHAAALTHTSKEKFLAATSRLVCEQLDAQKQIILGPRLTREHVERILKGQMDRFNVSVPEILP